MPGGRADLPGEAERRFPDREGARRGATQPTGGERSVDRRLDSMRQLRASGRSWFARAVSGGGPSRTYPCAGVLSGDFRRPRVVFGDAPIVVYMRADSPVAEEAEGAVPDEDQKRTAHRALVDRILNGKGRASAQQRAHAYRNDGLPPPLDTLIGKVATNPTQVTDADFAAAKASGVSEDQLFELVICAAVGQSARLYEAALAALAEATVDGEAG